MGFFDKFIDASGHFETAKDGRHLYFPFPFPFPMGRGYIISSEADYQRLRKKVKISYVGALIYLLLLFPVPSPRLELALFFGVICYALWSYGLCRYLERSEEKIDDKYNFEDRAREASFIVLWVLEICFIGVVAAAILLISWDWPRNLGLGLILITCMGHPVFIVTKTYLAKKRLGMGTINSS
jgi:hypothetical protein